MRNKMDYLKEAIKVIIQDNDMSLDAKTELIEKVCCREEYVQLDLFGNEVFSGSAKDIIEKYNHSCSEKALKASSKKGLFYRVGHVVRLEHIIYGVRKYLNDVSNKVYIFEEIADDSFQLNNSELILCSKGLSILQDLQTPFSLNLKNKQFNSKGVRDKPYYDISFGRRDVRSLHRFLTSAPKDRVVDHINGNKLDNRLSNLRVCTQQENVLNRMSNNPMKYKKSSKYNGVSKSSSGRYRFDISICNKRFSKTFESEYRASVYSDIIKLGYSEEFARTNHPKESYDMDVVRRFYNLYIKNNLKN